MFLALGLVTGLDGPRRMSAASATTITVTTTADELNYPIGDGDCSLREAIHAANADAPVDACEAGSGADTIYLPAGIYTLTIAGGGEDLNVTGDLDIWGTLTLNGQDMATTIINANQLDRALEVHFLPPATTFTLRNLTVYNSAEGGGLATSVPTVVSNTTFLSNTFGGAIFGGPATVVMSTTFISNAHPGSGCGGAYFGGSATVINTTFINNTSDGVGGACFKGLGVGDPVTVTVTGTTFINNTGRYGGGAYFSGVATAMVTATTFISNTADYGGGMYYETNPVASTGNFVNVLLAANRATLNRGAALYAALGGGPGGTVTLRHVTIASPTVVSGSAVFVGTITVNITDTLISSYTTGLELSNGILNENYNLFSNVTWPYTGTVVGLVSGGNSITGTSAFADTITYKLSSASAAIDAGTDVGVTTDFEGDPRPLGAGFDIGWDEHEQGGFRFKLYLPLVLRNASTSVLAP